MVEVKFKKGGVIFLENLSLIEYIELCELSERFKRERAKLERANDIIDEITQKGADASNPIVRTYYEGGFTPEEVLKLFKKTAKHITGRIKDIEGKIKKIIPKA